MLTFRQYGSSPSTTIVLHGGPGAPGSAAPIALELAHAFHVLEPFQRPSEMSSPPLTVATHVADLHQFIASHDAPSKPALVGISWGAMLALAYAAAHPQSPGPIVLVSCGTFDLPSRQQLNATLQHRINQSPSLRRQLDNLAAEFPNDPAARLANYYQLTRHLYDFDPIPDPSDPDPAHFDFDAHSQTWNDMLRLQSQGLYPAAFSNITSPVLMLHGQYDPHPGSMIFNTLRQYIPHIQYHLLPLSGHSPWREQHARHPFYSTLLSWLQCHLQPPSSASPRHP